MNTQSLFSRLYRSTLLLMAITALSYNSYAQTADQYTASVSSGVSLVAQTSPAMLLTAPNDDNITATPRGIGFPFYYEGVAYTHFVVSPDGFIRLLTSASGSGSDEPLNATASTTNTPKLMAFWDDLALGGGGWGGYVSYSLEGSSPNQRAVIEWNVTMPHSTIGAPNTKFQAVLNQSDNTIQYIYGGTPAARPVSASVGLGGANAGKFLSVTSVSLAISAAVANDTNTFFFPAGTAITFTPPPCSGTPVPGTITANVNPVCAGSTTMLTVAGTTVAAGISLQWMASVDNVTFNAIPGATSASYTATLGANKMYYNVVASCSSSTPAATAASNTLTVSVSNPPSPATLPFKESFESWSSACATTDRPGASWLTIPGTGDAAWRRQDQGASASWTNPATGIYAPAFSAGSGSARFHTAGAAAGQQGIMDAYINLSPAGTKLISFDHINTSGSDTLFVELSADGGQSFSELGYVTNSAAWTSRSFTTASTEANAIIRLRAKSDGGSTDIGVDNLIVTACLAPTALSAVVTPASASLGFTPAGTPGLFEIQYGSASFAAGAGTRIYTTNNPYNLTGLSVGTNYSFFVRSVCGAGDTSAYSARQTFATSCTTATLPFAEQFYSYLPNNCWTEATGQLSASTTLTAAASAWTGGNYLNSSSIWNPAAAINMSTGTKRDWLISPSIDLGSPAPGASYALEFNVGNVNAAGGPTVMASDDTVAVVISTDNGATWSSSHIVKLFTAASNPGGLRYFVPLEGYSGLIKVGFYASEGALAGLNTEFFLDSILVSSCTRPAVALGNDTVICPAATITLDAGNPGSSYLFSNSDITRTSAVTAAGTYSVEVIDPKGCIGRDTIVITSDVNPVVRLGNDTTICPDGIITLDAGNPGDTYLYSNSATTRTTTVTAGGTYSVAVTNANKCVGRDTIVITQGVNPVVKLGNDTVLCPAQTITLDAGNAGSTYLYSTSATTRTIAVTSAGTYSVKVTNAAKCVGRDTIVIAAGSNPIVSLGRDTLVCPGDTITLNAGNAGSTYLYSTGITTQTARVLSGGVYSVAVTNANKCVGRDTIAISNGVNPVVALGNDTVICPGATITLDGGSFGTGFAYLYSNSAATQRTNVTAAGTYTLRVTNTATGCRGRDTIVIAQGFDPGVNLGNDTIICPGMTITLNAGNPGSTYLYNTGATTRLFSVHAAGTYSVEVTNANKCVNRDTIVISQGVDPIVNLGPDTTICSGKVITLDAGNIGSTYLFSTGSRTQTLSVIPAGTYWVQVTNSQKCVGRDTIVISVTPLASVSSITPLRTGLSVAFGSDAQHASTYQWSFGDNTTSGSAAPSHTYTSNGTYTVRLIVSNDCASDTATTTMTISGVGTGNVGTGNEELRLYPNPASSAITLDNKSGLRMESAAVLNSIGAVVLKKDGLAAKKETLDISMLPAGTYMVRIQTDGGTVLRKLQVVK
jgi:hypothetical protein